MLPDMNIPSNLRTIIDGYNLIFQCGLEGRARNPTALEKARNRLVGVIAKHLSESQCSQTAIVFDAESLPIRETEKVARQHGVLVAYAIDYEDADSMIEDLISSHSSPKQLTVVSSDHRLHKASMRRNATPIDSDLWLDQLESGTLTNQEIASDRESFDKTIPDSFSNVDWASEFGLDDDDQSFI